MPSQTHHEYALQCHPACIACRNRVDGGLGLQFESTADGSVEARYECEAFYQGYPDRLHGGIIATLLDAAMTHCLFSKWIRGYTAKLQIRYRHPVRVGEVAIVRAALCETREPLHRLTASIVQEGRICAKAEATFVKDNESI
ncbi:MAG: hypothetical protein HJJLKODD_01716 [Phycisphaerae bacterium]|nr:hypothetical protein [Phycisphaerae bacterium]